MKLDLDIQVRRGTTTCSYTLATDAPIVGVFGRSGAGKTTLLHAIAGLLPATTGRVRVGDDVLLDSAAGIDLPTHRRGLGVVFQDDRLLPHLRVEANLTYGMPRGARDAPALDEVVRGLGLSALGSRRIRNLSGGERRRVAIGRALLAAPALLLLDEALVSLDRHHRAESLELIRASRARLGTPMLYVSHDLGEILRLTDEVLVIEDGRSVGHGPLREIVQRPHVWPALRDLGPLNVVPVAVTANDPAAGFTRYAIRGATNRTLIGPLSDRPVGTAMDAAVRAEDIALGPAAVPEISIRNQLAGTVRRITAHPDRSLVEVDIGVPVLVEVSHQAVAQLELAPGRQVWCLVKSNALRCIE